MVDNYRELRIWQDSVQFAKELYGLADKLPDKERYGLRAQMTRAAISVASNIAEGSRRRGTNELVQFLSIALGSLAEVETQLIIAKEIGFYSDTEIEPVMKRADSIARGIVKLKQTLEKR